ncbi:hypothetical protein [Promicromonospora sp. NPDC023987]|uniref:hypothetical protein n=1 Tax=Promicromonospora sp. NPDC023987 TaxID=3155360 RepID=UPI0033E1D185
MTREGKWWIGEVAAVPGATTEVTRLADLQTEVRDLLGGLLDMDDDAFELTWDMSAVLGPEGQAMWEKYLTERAELAERRARFEADRADTVRLLHDAGVSVRDSAALVELSHQRVSQLLNS